MGRAGLEKNLPLLKSEELSEGDKEKLEAIFYKRSLTKTMLSEINYIQENAEKVKSNGIPASTPMYFFVAGDNVDITPNWKEELAEYVSKTDSGKFKVLETGHYVHHEKSDIIAEEIKGFLKESCSN